MLFAFVDMYIQSDFQFKNLLLLILGIIFVVFGLIWIYSMGIFIDQKNDKLKIKIGFSKKERVERVLSIVESVDVELYDGIGMYFIINYKYYDIEKIKYVFYRISFVEKWQYKRIKKQLSNIKYGKN